MASVVCVAELAQVHLARLVGAVLAPHHRVHGQLGRRWAGGRGSRGSAGTRRASARARPRAARRPGCRRARPTVSSGDGVDASARVTQAASSVCRRRREVKNRRPSRPSVPVRGSGRSRPRRRARGAASGRPRCRAALEMPAMSRYEPLGLSPEVAGDDAALALEPVEGALVGDEAALAVLQRDDDLLALRRTRWSRRWRCARPAAAGRGRRSAVVVADQRAGQQVRLAQHLEAVADAEHRQPAVGAPSTSELHHRARTGRSRRSAGSRRRRSRRGGRRRRRRAGRRRACQSATASPPASRTARAASLSSSEPGKVTTPTRISPPPGRSSEAVTASTRTTSSITGL